MKKFIKSTLIIASITMALSSCKDACKDVVCATGYVCDNGDCVVDPNAAKDGNVTKSGAITTNETWTADKIYELAGKVVVDGGATLTIEAGTIIKGREGAGSLASALIIARGSKINAAGTAAKPIIFTSVLDNIKVGELSGTNLDETDNGKWGGLVLLGNAKISAKVGDTEAQIEGVPADETYGKYGGTNDADNSGVLTYVSIRHGGALIGEGNELNGLTLGGVGTGTIINHIEVVANLDDGIECFGGSVNITNALVAYQGDDALDIDQNYSGTFDNAMVVYNNNGDEFMEIDGPENATYSTGLFTIKNSSFVSKTSDGTVDLKSKAQGTIENCKFTGLSKYKLSASYETDCVTPKTDAYDYFVANPSKLKVTGNSDGGAAMQVYTASVDASQVACPVTAGYQTSVDAIHNAAGNNSSATGASTTEFANWTWTSVNNKF